MNSEEGARDPGLHGEHIGLQRLGQVAPEDRDQAPKSVRISSQSSIDPSWFPQTPEYL